MEKQPLVTAIITTYKREAEIVGRALNSIAAQTYDELEIILVNDYPEDDALSSELAALCAGCDRKVLYLPMDKNSGANPARNRGAAAAHGEFIAFLDDDDEWEPEKIGMQVRAAVSDPNVGIVYGNFIVKSPKSTGLRVGNDKMLPEGNIYSQLFKSNVIGSTSFPLIRKKAFDNAGGFNEEVPALQDMELWLRITESCRVRYLSEQLGTYYFYEGDRLSAHPERRIKGYEMIRERHLPYLEAHPHTLADFNLFGVTLYINGRDFSHARKLLNQAIRLNPKNVKNNLFMTAKWIIRFFIPAKVV